MGWCDADCKKSKEVMKKCVEEEEMLGRGEIGKQVYDRRKGEYRKFCYDKRQLERNRFMEAVSKAIREGRKWEAMNRVREGSALTKKSTWMSESGTLSVYCKMWNMVY